jgi:hypothetical protein
LPAVTRSPALLRRVLFALFLGLTALCVLAKPVTGATHEIHDLVHVLEESGAVGIDPDAGGGGDIDPLHAEDGCCFHAAALPLLVTGLIVAPAPSDPPGWLTESGATSLPSRALRPPSSA